MLRNFSFLLFASFLAGCSAFVVQVKHPPVHMEPRTNLETLQNCYILIQKPGKRDWTAVEQVAGKVILDEIKKIGSVEMKMDSFYLSELSGDLLGKTIANEFISQGMEITGYQTGDLEDFQKFSFGIFPSSVLLVRLTELSLEKEIREEDKITEEKNQDAKKVIKFWWLKGSLHASIQLDSLDGTQFLAQQTIVVPIQKKLDSEPELQKWIKENQEQLAEALAKRIIRRFFPASPILRTRMVKRDKNFPLLTEGTKAAWKNQWKKAEQLWKDSAEKERNALAYHNLGVSSERVGNWKEALLYYKKADEISRELKEPPFADWQKITEELEAVLRSQPPLKVQEKSPTWFEKKVAILPFSNESNFAAAPEWISNRLYLKLQEKGYNLLPLDTTRNLLKEIGITDGGQLPAYKSHQIAKKLECDFLLYGQIFEFKEIPLGIYYKRELDASFKIVDGKSGKAIWENRKKVLKEKVTAPKEAASEAVWQLAKSLAERALRIPFREEIEELLERIFESLPGKI